MFQTTMAIEIFPFSFYRTERYEITRVPTIRRNIGNVKHARAQSWHTRRPYRRMRENNIDGILSSYIRYALLAPKYNITYDTLPVWGTACTGVRGK